MKKLSLEEWDKEYIVGPVERFDEKNTMFIRPVWDAGIKDAVKTWFFEGDIKDRPGYSAWDLALRRSSQQVTRFLGLFNISKPNPSRASTAMMEAMASVNPQLRKMASAQLENAKKIDVSNPLAVTRYIKKAAQFFGADIVGICKLDRRWAYSHTYEGLRPETASNTDIAPGLSIPQEIPAEYQYAIVMAYNEEYEMLRYFPSWIAHSVTSMGYSRMAITNTYVSAFVRHLGFKAISSGNDVAQSIPMAMQAGLGELGRNGLLISPQFGPRVRLSKIITDLPLEVDSPIQFGVTEFCTKCGKCAQMCPSQSILYGDRTAEPNNISNSSGHLKWPINAETCRAYWGRMNQPCTTCISSCPYNKPYTWPHRATLWFTDHLRWADPLYVKLDDLLGYGKPKKPDGFWDSWQTGQQ